MSGWHNPPPPSDDLYISPLLSDVLELDAKRSIDQGVRLAAEIETGVISIYFVVPCHRRSICI